MVEELGEWCANQEFFCCACDFRVTASKPLWCYLIPAGWLPDSGQKAKTTETRTPDLEASAAQSGLSFLRCLAQVHGWRGILERRSLSGQLPSGRGTSLWFCLASLGSFLGLGGFRFFVGQCRSDAWGIAGLRAHWAMWFSLSHAVPRLVCSAVLSRQVPTHFQSFRSWILWPAHAPSASMFVSIFAIKSRVAANHGLRHPSVLDRTAKPLTIGRSAFPRFCHLL